MSAAMRRWLPVAIVVVGTVLAVAHRNPSLVLSPRLFCEDLFVFFNEDRLFGAWAFVQPYAGYYQLSSRIIAFAAGFAPPTVIPSLYAALFILVILTSAMMLYTSPVFSGWGKVLAALAIVASPTGSEVFYGMCYSLWITAPIAALALYERPISRVRAALLLWFYLMVGLSSAFIVLVAPLAIIKLFTERSRYAICIAAVTLLAIAAQARGMFNRAGATVTSGSVVERLSIAKSVFYSWIVGPGDPGEAMAIVLCIAVMALAAWYLWRNRHIASRATLYFVGFGMTVLVASCLTLPPQIYSNPFESGARYFYLAVVLSVLAVIAIEQSSPRWRTTLPIVAAVLAANYAAWVHDLNDQLLDRNWGQTVACLQTSSNCVAVLNPPGVGSTRVPSDSELKQMTWADRGAFRAQQRLP